MAWVADYIHRIAPATLKAAGVVGVCRYLSWQGALDKEIGQAEYDELRAAGIAVILNWEYDSQDWLGGATGAEADATEAVRQARALGYPRGSVIVGSADFDMTAGDWSREGSGYAHRFRDIISAAGYRAGVYGPWDVLGWCKQAGYDWFWQAGMSISWSGGRNASLWPGAHLRQVRHAIVGGQDVDHNDIERSDWRGVSVTTPIEQQQSYKDIAAGVDDILELNDPSHRGDHAVNQLARTLAAHGEALARIEATLAQLSAPLAGGYTATGHFDLVAEQPST